jgi:hypothetical protein
MQSLAIAEAGPFADPVAPAGDGAEVIQFRLPRRRIPLEQILADAPGVRWVKGQYYEVVPDATVDPATTLEANFHVPNTARQQIFGPVVGATALIDKTF